MSKAQTLYSSIFSLIVLLLIHSSISIGLKMPSAALHTPKYHGDEVTTLSKDQNIYTGVEPLKKVLSTDVRKYIAKFYDDQIAKSEKPMKEFLLSFSLNFFSEIGDKSFVSIILVYNQISTLALFFIATFAEVLMNLFSVYIGYQLRVHTNIRKIIQGIGMVTSLLFALSLIYELFQQVKEEEEKEEAATATVKEGEDIEPGHITIESNGVEQTNKHSIIKKVFNITWIIFLSELGDKSQITTILLSTEYSPLPIFLGTALAHIAGVIISLTIGYLVSNKINNRILTSMGALCFLYFGMQMAINFFATK